MLSAAVWKRTRAWIPDPGLSLSRAPPSQASVPCSGPLFQHGNPQDGHRLLAPASYLLTGQEPPRWPACIATSGIVHVCAHVRMFMFSSSMILVNGLRRRPDSRQGLSRLFSFLHVMPPSFPCRWRRPTFLELALKQS